MRVFLAGATGAIGKRLVPMLVGAGHQVMAMTRTADKADGLRQLGAEPVVLDAFDRAGVIAAVRAAAPDAVVHQLTAIPETVDFRTFGESFAVTNRLRTEGLDNLLAGAHEAGAQHFIAQSFAGWPYAREGGPVKTEEDALDPAPSAGFRDTLAAIKTLEDRMSRESGLRCVALRYGILYGPGTSIAPGGAVYEAVKARKVPVVGGGGGIWSFTHIDDAAGSTVAALAREARGIFNAVDDEPAAVREWLPYLAKVVGAGRPWRVPAFIARWVIGRTGVEMMTEIRGASNAKAKRELGWQPAVPSWREGFRELASGA